MKIESVFALVIRNSNVVLDGLGAAIAINTPSGRLFWRFQALNYHSNCITISCSLVIGNSQLEYICTSCCVSQLSSYRVGSYKCKV